MEINDSFRVDLPVEETWRVLMDIERIAPCLPGAQLQEIAGEEYRGVVKVKVGPITAQYKGAAFFESRDNATHVAVIKGSGRDTRGQGNASATITMRLVADGGDASGRAQRERHARGRAHRSGAVGSAHEQRRAEDRRGRHGPHDRLARGGARRPARDGRVAAAQAPPPVRGRRAGAGALAVPPPAAVRVVRPPAP